MDEANELRDVRRLAEERRLRVLVLPKHALDDASHPTEGGVSYGLVSTSEDGSGPGVNFATVAEVRAYLETVPIEVPEG